MAVSMSEIIHCVDSEITAVPAVVKKNGSPQAAELYHCCRRQQFRSAKAEFRSSRRREFHFALQSELPPQFRI